MAVDAIEGGDAQQQQQQQDHQDARGTKSLKTKILEVVWDGERSEDERKLVQRLDIFLMYVFLSTMFPTRVQISTRYICTAKLMGRYLLGAGQHLGIS